MKFHLPTQRNTYRQLMRRVLRLAGLVLVIGFISSFYAYTPALQNGELNENRSITTMEKIKLGNEDQWLIIRGKDLGKPVLLFLHGGPGSTASAHLQKFLPELEDRFIVVHWDQRGAGKSYRAGSGGKLTLERLIEDTVELSEYLIRRFEKQKIYLMGASWGTYLGIEAAKRRPEYYHAYIGSGQIVHQWRGEQLANEFLMEKARDLKDMKTLARIEKLGKPPYPREKHVDYLYEQRGILQGYGGSVRNSEVRRQFSNMWIILRQPEYTLIDKINWIRGQYRSERILGPEFRKINFLEDATELKVPVYIMQGVHDMQTPTSLVEEYYSKLKAPHKELHLFLHSGHIPIVEEKEKFLILLDQILAEKLIL